MKTLNVVSFVTVLTPMVFSFANGACQRVNDGGGKPMLIPMFFRETARLLTKSGQEAVIVVAATQLVKYVLRFLRHM